VQSGLGDESALNPATFLKFAWIPDDSSVSNCASFYWGATRHVRTSIR
jgi:hypothetical protein